MTPAALCLVLSLSLAQESPEPAPKARRDEWQYLTKHFTLDGFDTKKPPGNGGFTGRGSSFQEGHLPAGEAVPLCTKGPYPRWSILMPVQAVDR